jgi:hypothetical protein
MSEPIKRHRRARYKGIGKPMALAPAPATGIPGPWTPTVPFASILAATGIPGPWNITLPVTPVSFVAQALPKVFPEVLEVRPANDTDKLGMDLVRLAGSFLSKCPKEFWILCGVVCLAKAMYSDD